MSNHLVVPIVVFTQESLLKLDIVINQQRTLDYLAPCAIVIRIFVNQSQINFGSTFAYRLYIIAKSACTQSATLLIPLNKLESSDVLIGIKCLIYLRKHLAIYQIVIAIQEEDILTLGVLQTYITSIRKTAIKLVYSFNEVILSRILITNLR